MLVLSRFHVLMCIPHPLTRRGRTYVFLGGGLSPLAYFALLDMCSTVVQEMGSSLWSTLFRSTPLATSLTAVVVSVYRVEHFLVSRCVGEKTCMRMGFRLVPGRPVDSRIFWFCLVRQQFDWSIVSIQPLKLRSTPRLQPRFFACTTSAMISRLREFYIQFIFKGRSVSRIL